MARRKKFCYKGYTGVMAGCLLFDVMCWKIIKWCILKPIWFIIKSIFKLFRWIGKQLDILLKRESKLFEAILGWPCLFAEEFMKHYLSVQPLLSPALVRSLAITAHRATNYTPKRKTPVTAALVARLLQAYFYLKYSLPNCHKYWSNSFVVYFSSPKCWRKSDRIRLK